MWSMSSVQQGVCIIVYRVAHKPMMCESSQRSPYGFNEMGTHMITNVSSESGNGVANRCELLWFGSSDGRAFDC